ncbi:MAG: glycosyltransferase N-terminal domain-containing protein [Gammaproteobacteria bacterium]
MTINAVNSNNWFPQLNQLYNTNQATGTAQTGATQPTPPVDPPPGAGLVSAVTQALNQIGVGTSAASSTDSGSGASDASAQSASTTQNQAQAIQSFLQSLMAALQAQSGQSNSSDGTGTDNTNGPTTGVRGTGGLHHARMSDRSFPKYYKIRWFYTHIFRHIDEVYEQTQKDKERLELLGTSNMPAVPAAGDGIRAQA